MIRLICGLIIGQMRDRFTVRRLNRKLERALREVAR